ncbi:hypothetical protein B0H19DRAFT_1275703 [Mycena capillaripes]|nr:hypothetical protein B0H19DRAFT_1275703 [Mycena capillaripes]
MRLEIRTLPFPYPRPTHSSSVTARQVFVCPFPAFPGSLSFIHMPGRVSALRILTMVVTPIVTSCFHLPLPLSAISGLLSLARPLWPRHNSSLPPDNYHPPVLLQCLLPSDPLKRVPRVTS